MQKEGGTNMMKTEIVAIVRGLDGLPGWKLIGAIQHRLQQRGRAIDPEVIKKILAAEVIGRIGTLRDGRFQLH